MSIKESILRVLRRFFYRWQRKAEKRYHQLSRELLRTVSNEPDPIYAAQQITDRRVDDHWKTLQPVWVLSTGRTGTNTLTELFRLSPKIDPYHEPSPELFQLSHDYYMRNIDRQQALSALMYARDEWVFRSVRDSMIYVETNNRVTYLADLLLELYPQSKFLYLYRNPYDFIRSGMRRSYYDGHLRDPGRITPTSKDDYYDEWKAFSTLEKVAWNWRTVNRHCLRFLEQLPESQKIKLSSETLFTAGKQETDRLFDFIGSSEYHPPASEIQDVLGTRYNAQKKGSFSKADNWTDEQTASVDRIIRPVAQELSYQLLTPPSEQKLHSK